MKRPDDKQSPQGGADPAAAPVKGAPPPHQAGPRDAAPMRADFWSGTVDVWFRTVARDQQFRCPGCGYDLRGLPAPGGFFRCPECGEVAARYEAMVHKHAMRWWGRWRHHVLAITLVAALLVLLALLIPDDFTYEVVVSIVIIMILTYVVQRFSHTNRQVSPRLPGRDYRERATTGVDRALSKALHTPPEAQQGSGDQAPEARSGNGSPMGIQQGHEGEWELSMSATCESGKRGLAAVMFALACFVTVAVMEPLGGPLLPTLKNFFGTPFGVAFLAAQLGYTIIFRIKRGWIWILGFCILRIPFFFLTSNTALWRNPEAMSGLGELITGAACLSALMLGLLVFGRRL